MKSNFIIELILFIIEVLLLVIFVPLIIGIGIALFLDYTGVMYYIIILGVAFLIWLCLIIWWYV